MRFLLIILFVFSSSNLLADIAQKDKQQAWEYGSKIRFAFFCKFIPGSQYAKLRDGYVVYIKKKFNSKSDREEALDYLLEGLNLDYDKWKSKCASANKKSYINLMNKYLKKYPRNW